MLAQWLAGEKSEVATSAGVLISDAGIASVNGTYVLDGQNEGKNKYSFNGNYIQWDLNVWIIFSSEVDESGYVSNDDTEFPWQATWESQSGYEPYPVVTEVPATNPTANYVTLPERYLWAKIAVAAGAPKTEADYISLPKNYVWSDIYNSVSGDISESTVVVSGLSDTSLNGRYVYDGDVGGKPSYKLNENVSIYWDQSISKWEINSQGDNSNSDSDVAYPWLAAGWVNNGIDPTGLILTPETPNHIDWSEKQALGHIAAAYRGDTGNPANLATYIDWPWRYQVASIITAETTDADVLAFIEESGATDIAGLDAFVKGVKDLGLWNSLVFWPLRSTQNAGTGTTAYSLGGFGAYTGTLVNGPSWGANGITFVGGDDYISTSLSLESLPQVGFLGFHANTDSESPNSGTVIGGGNADSGQAMGLQYRPQFNAYPYAAFYGGDLNGGGVATSSFISTACAYGTGYRRLWRGGVLVANSSDAVTIGSGSVAIGGKPAAFEFFGGSVALAAVIVGPLETSTVSALNSLYQQTLGTGLGL
jgi:uncharacterized Zn-binding protein involved in type VI secretion